MDWTQLDPAWIIINVVVLFFSLSIHESAHAWTADRLGDPTARYLGRVSLNPIVHIDLMGTVVFPLIGLLSGWALFGWAKPVPVSTRNLANPKRDHLLIAAAGPASNVVAAVIFLVAIKFMTAAIDPMTLSGHAVWEPLFLLFRVGLLLNVILAVFNLIPVPPLDGSWVLSGLLPDGFSRLMDQVRPYGFMLLILLLLSGVFGSVLRPVLGFVNGLAV